MVENRKLFYAISLMLLTCCQIITMLPHNVASGESSSNSPGQSSNSTARNNNYNVKEEYVNNSSNSTRKNTNSNSNSNNNNTADDDKSDSLIIAVASQRNADEHTIVSGEEAWQGQENDSRPMDNIDDLIFLDKRPINQQQQQQQQHHHHHSEQGRQQYNQHQQLLDHHHPIHTLHNEHKHYEFHHITMDGGSSNSNSDSDEDTDSLTDTTYSTMIVVDDDDVVGGGEQETESGHDDGIPHEIELQPDINEEVTPLNVTPLDLSDFLSLIPATKVKAIVNHYYHNDPEVQRAHAFMSSRDFLMLKQHIIAIPEMSAFLRYLNNSGLDLVKFVTALTNLTAYNNDEIDGTKRELATASATTELDEQQPTTLDKTMAQTNDIEYVEKQSVTVQPTLTNIEMETMNATITTVATPPATTMDDMNETIAATTMAKEQLNGLHGLVDNVLDVLPQDQILATFFDKLEANEQFSKLVDNIGSPEFAKILNNMQNSIPLRNLIFTLHNNGIYVIRIVDSLKSYFFLGGF